MVCPKCRCEFVGWSGECPYCKVPLVEALPPVLQVVDVTLPYEELVARVEQNGGQLRVDLSTTDVGMRRGRSFPYFGYGFAWAKRMQGALDHTAVDLVTAEIGEDRKRGFPYSGYGFAWVRRMEGHVGGNQVTLTATKVKRETSQGFPYRGYGFAWTREMAGQCGPQVHASLSITDVVTRRRWSFPYSGYGYAWENGGSLVLSLAA